MSGIEVPIGLAAAGVGLVSLAIQLNDSAMKLKSFYSAAKNAPETISRLIKDLELTSFSLRTLEPPQQQDNQAIALLERCRQTCVRCTDDIEALVGHMEKRMAHSKKIGKLYVAFQGNEMRTLLENLHWAKSDLQLAYMAYLQYNIMKQKHQLDKINADIQTGNEISQQILFHVQSTRNRHIEGPKSVSEGESLTVAKLETGSDRTKDDKRIRHSPALPAVYRRQQLNTQISRFRVSFPAWLTSRVWDLALEISQTGFGLTLNLSRIRPNDSLIFQLCHKGDLHGVRRLIASGDASLIDVDSDGVTLLRYAASAVSDGHVGLCRWLLSQTKWPNQQKTLSSALSIEYEDKITTITIKVFMNDYGFDVSFEPQHSYSHDDHEPTMWLSEEYMQQGTIEYVFRHQYPPLESRELQDRFELAMGMIDPSRAVFLRCIGLDAFDSRLGTLSTRRGGLSALHFVAGKLQYVPSWNDAAIRMVNSEWGVLALGMLKHRVDPSKIAYVFEPTEHAATPLLSMLTSEENFMRGKQGIMPLIRLWTYILERAGLDLRACGREEKRAWETAGAFEPTYAQWNDGDRGIHRGREPYCFSELLYGDSPDEWGVKLRRLARVNTYELQVPPGAFVGPQQILRTICWPPDGPEMNEGYWKQKKLQHVVTSAPFDLQSDDPVDNWNEAVLGLFESAQDDYGAIVLMDLRQRHAKKPTARSHSQPPQLYGTSIYGSGKTSAYTTERGVAGRPWFPGYHTCPWDGKRRSDCIKIRQSRRDASWGRTVYHVRSCAKGESISAKKHMREYYTEGFLDEIRHCQQPNKFFPLLHVRTSHVTRHTEAKDCPQGCNRVKNVSRSAFLARILK